MQTDVEIVVDEPKYFGNHVEVPREDLSRDQPRQ